MHDEPEIRFGLAVAPEPHDVIADGGDPAGQADLHEAVNRLKQELQQLRCQVQRDQAQAKLMETRMGRQLAAMESRVNRR